jgi:hypothetical protein
MGLASDIRKKIEKKYKDLRDLESQRSHVQRQLREIDTHMREVQSAIQAYEDVLKMTPADKDDDKSEPNIRPNSMVALARDALRKVGQPLHVGKLLEAMGKQPSHDMRVSLSGSLAAYVRNKQVFTKPEPNTFGLIEWQQRTLELSEGGPEQRDVDGSTSKTAAIK